MAIHAALGEKEAICTFSEGARASPKLSVIDAPGHGYREERERGGWAALKSDGPFSANRGSREVCNGNVPGE